MRRNAPTSVPCKEKILIFLFTLVPFIFLFFSDNKHFDTVHLSNMAIFSVLLSCSRELGFLLGGVCPGWGFRAGRRSSVSFRKPVILWLLKDGVVL